MFDAGPEDWRRGRVLDFFQLQRGFDLPVQSRKRGDVPVIASNGQVGFHDVSPIPAPAVTTGRSGTIGRVVYSPTPCWPLNTTLFVSDFKGAHPAFVYYFLQHFPLKEHASGTGVPTLNRNDVHAVEVSVPPVDEQQRIAEVLNSVDETISANMKALQQAERARAAVLFTAFERAGWEPVRLAELGRWRSGATPAKGVAENWGGGIPWFCPRDMKAPVLSRSQTSISRAALGGSCRLVPQGTLLLVVRGMILAKAIPTAITAVEGTHNQDIKSFAPDSRVDPRFIQLCIQHQEKELLRLTNTATHGTKKIDTSVIDEVPIPLPDRTTQETLIGTVAGLDANIVSYGTEHLRLHEVRRGLLSDLLSGRVRVPA